MERLNIEIAEILRSTISVLENIPIDRFYEHKNAVPNIEIKEEGIYCDGKIYVIGSHNVKVRFVIRNGNAVICRLYNTNRSDRAKVSRSSKITIHTPEEASKAIERKKAVFAKIDGEEWAVVAVSWRERKFFAYSPKTCKSGWFENYKAVQGFFYSYKDADNKLKQKI